jgi:hypothetical protein
MTYLDTILMVVFEIWFIWLSVSKKEKLGSKSKLIMIGGIAFIVLGVVFLFR